MADVVEVLAGAEEFALGDGPVGVLLIHGFTGSPQSMRGIGEHLAEKGLSVVCPRLPGHGTTWQDLNTKTTDDWVETVDSEFHRLAASKDEVFLVALSFGAALALDLAACYPDRVAGIVTCAGLVHTKDPRRFFAPIIRRLVASVPGVGNDIALPDATEIAYDRFPTTAGHWMLKFIARTRRGLGAVTAPILIMHGRKDRTVGPHNAKLIHDAVGSGDKEVVYLDRSAHVILLDYDRDEVFERTFNFITEHSKVL